MFVVAGTLLLLVVVIGRMGSKMTEFRMDDRSSMNNNNHNNFSNEKVYTMGGSSSSSSVSSDSLSFDRAFYKWESDLYKRRNQLVSVAILGSTRTNQQQRQDEEDPSPIDELIYFNHSKAFQMLQTSTHSHDDDDEEEEDFIVQDFYYYQQGWEAQINQAYCGVASTMAVLNSLRGLLPTLPQDPIYRPFPWATQLSLMDNECVKDTVYNIDEMNHIFWGLGLDMATTLINCHLQGQGYIATAYHVDPTTTTMMTTPTSTTNTTPPSSSSSSLLVDHIRSVFRTALKERTTRLMINYDRGGITQGPLGHGHFSPIGAYNEEKDAFLILDVAKYKYPPVWVSTKNLVGGIATYDHCANFLYPNHPIDFMTIPTDELTNLLQCQPRYRGYILITKEEDDDDDDTDNNVNSRTKK